MGGCTITKIAENKTWLLAEMEQQILRALEMGLWPDSELIIIEHGAEEAEIYKVLVKDNEALPSFGKWIIGFEKVEKGRAFHVGVAGRFGPKPGPDEWVGTIHVHS